MKYLSILVIYLSCILGGQELSAQCSRTDTLVIKDLDTTYYSLDIEDVNANDLASGLQNVDYIRLHIEHGNINNIRVNLVSPAGQRVNLMGPALPQPNWTNNVKWEVNFVDCGNNIVNPDAGFNNVWDNTNNWVVNRTYTGTYFPSIGCLSDINTGTITGTWNIEIIDLIAGSNDNLPNGKPTSFISHFSIGFTDESGLECFSCKKFSSMITSPNADITGCAGSSGLDLNLEYTIESIPSNYDYGHIITDKSGNIIEFGTDTNVRLSDNAPGDYILKGIFYYKNNASNIASFNTLNQLEQAVSNNVICATLSQNEIEIKINPKNIDKTITEVLCGPTDTYSFMGMDYSEGRFEVVSGGDPLCEEFTILDLSRTVLDVGLNVSATELSCDVRTIQITPNFNASWDVEWSTTDGNIVSVNDDYVATIDRPGTYSFTVEDANCEKTFNTTVTANDDLAWVDINGNDINCALAVLNPVTSGNIESFQWYRGGNSITEPLAFSTMTPGVYVLEITNDLNCTDRDTIEIKDVSPSISYNLSTQEEITCDNLAITGEISGIDKADYDITWFLNGSQYDTDSYTSEYNNGGTYSVEVKGKQNACKKTFTTTVVSQKDTLNIIPRSEPIKCNADGFATYLSLGATSYEWLNGNSVLESGSTNAENDTLFTSTPGTFTLNLTSNKGCITSTEITVAEDKNKPNLLPSEAVIDCINPTTPLLSSIPANTSIEWIFPDGSTKTGNPPATEIGSYNYTITNKDNGCSRSSVLNVIPDPNQMDSIKFDLLAITCSDPISIASSSPSNGYTFKWTPQSTGASIQNGGNTSTPQINGAGIFTVDVTKGSCTNTYRVEIPIDTISTLEKLSADNLSCTKDSVQIKINSPYTFSRIQWGPFVGLSDPSIAEPFAKIDQTYTAAYTFNENGCSGQQSITIKKDASVPDISIRSLSSDSLGCEGEIALEISTGISTSNVTNIDLLLDEDVLTSSMDSTFMLKTYGNYRVAVEGVGQCFDTLPIIIRADTLKPSFDSLSKSNDIYCNDPASTLMASNLKETIDYRWMLNQDSVLNVGLQYSTNEPNTYYFIAKHERTGCSRIDSIELLDKREYPEYTLEGDSVINCDHLVINPEIITSENNKVTWIDNNGQETESTSLEISADATYTFRIENEQRCITEDSIVVPVDTVPIVFEQNISGAITCSSPMIDINVTSNEPKLLTSLDGLNYSESSTLTVEEGGIYTLRVKGQNGCIDSIPVEVVVDTMLVRKDSLYFDTLKCKGPLPKLHFTSPDNIVSYQWEGPSYFSTDPSPVLEVGGRYYGYFTGENGCVYIDSIDVPDDRRFPLLKVNDVYTRCDGKPTPFEIDSLSGVDDISWFGIDISYSSSGLSASSSKPGFYEAIGTNAEGCPTIDTFQIIDEVVPPIFEIISDTFYCDGSTLYALSTEDDEAVEWSGPHDFQSQERTISIDSFGTYKITVTSPYGCKESRDITPKDGRNVIVPSVVQIGAFQCNTKKLDLRANINIPDDRAFYTWSTSNGSIESNIGSNQITVSSVGEYSVKITDSKTKCTGEKSYLLENEPPSFTTFDNTSVPPSCDGRNDGYLILENMNGDFPPYDIYLNGTHYGQNDTIPFLTPGVYNILIKDSIQCEVRDTITITEALNLAIQLPKDTLVDYGDTLFFNPIPQLDGAILDSVWWIGNLPCLDCVSMDYAAVENQTVSFNFNTVNGCQESALIKIRIREPLHAVPNSFSPNNDGNNDIFYIPGSKAFERINKVEIYSNWGDLVFKSSRFVIGDPSTGWDGKFQGKYVLPGVYTLILEATMIDGKTRVYKSGLNIVR